MASRESQAARNAAASYELDFQQAMDGLLYFTEWSNTKRIDFPIAKDLKKIIVELKKALPFAEEQIDKRYEACVRQSFSKARKDAMDESEHTKVGTKTKRAR